MSSIGVKADLESHLFFSKKIVVQNPFLHLVLRALSLSWGVMIFFSV